MILFIMQNRHFTWINTCNISSQFYCLTFNLFSQSKTFNLLHQHIIKIVFDWNQIDTVWHTSKLSLHKKLLSGITNKFVFFTILIHFSNILEKEKKPIYLIYKHFKNCKSGYHKPVYSISISLPFSCTK